MALLSEYNKKATTASLLENLSESMESRPYLGCSQLGHSCSRYLWLSFRWSYDETIGARLRRLFRRGHREEPEVIRELESIGITCQESQAEVVFGYGHIKGHCDGVIKNVPEAPKTPHVLEIKTMNDKYFKELIKLGIKESKPVYYAQGQLYMHGLKLSRAMFVCVNKNDDAYYVERIRYDKGFAEDLLRKGEYILLSEQPPERLFKSTWYECKFCSARKVCEGSTAKKTCRTCKNVEIHQGGEWKCSLKSNTLSVDCQRLACDSYTSIL